MQIIFTDGLGNEMFQYALYLAMRKRGRHPSMNICMVSWNQVHNGFELCDDFHIDRESLPIVSGRIIRKLTPFALKRKWKSLCYIEDVEVFNPKVFSTRKLFVKGYWQDGRYFSDVSDEVRRSFCFRGIDERNLALGHEMENRESVSIHIRRGDYLKYSFWQVCDPSYFKRAIEYMRSKVENPFFYVFSDDLEWSADFMNSTGVDYLIVGHNRGKESYKDMYLMTKCHHNIIANSSFSWWGAWLGNYHDKIVARPTVWIKGYKKDPCPSEWVCF